MDPDPKDLEHLVRDKYNGDRSTDLTQDIERLRSGEPLAYVIGSIPFLGLSIRLDSYPLIPRPETEWWTEELAKHLAERFQDAPVQILDLCAGSGAIGLALLARLTQAHVSFAELSPLHAALIAVNLDENGIDSGRADIRSGDLFTPFEGTRFNVIASNPPYVPSGRTLDRGVTDFEPSEALYAGEDGLDVIRRIARTAAKHLLPQGEVWLECDIDNVQVASDLLIGGGADHTLIRSDLYGRPRIVVGYFP